jgi:hypothetical protein
MSLAKNATLPRLYISFSRQGAKKDTKSSFSIIPESLLAALADNCSLHCLHFRHPWRSRMKKFKSPGNVACVVYEN